MSPPLLAAAAATFAAGAAIGYPLDHLKTRDDIGLNKIPHEGVSHVLVIPVRAGMSEFPRAELDAMRELYRADGGPGTFREYWKTVSLGKYDPLPVLVDPVLYPNSCPIPGRGLKDCTVTVTDIDLILNRSLEAAFIDVLQRVRDEQSMDLTQFDVNSDGGPRADGHFDGVVIDSNIYSGVAPPLAALGNTVTVAARPGGMGPMITMGTVAMVPPVHHEYGHLFGLIDLYGGPTVNDLMSDRDSTFGAFTRQQLGWGTVIEVQAPYSTVLMPALDSGTVLRIGAPPRYLLIEHRGGAHHDRLDIGAKGVYVYSVDEETLPTTSLGFVNLDTRMLYLPNEHAPYLDVALPVGCDRGDRDYPGTCIVPPGTERDLVHASGTDTGLTLKVAPELEANGGVTVQIYPKGSPLVDAGVPPDSGAAAPAMDAGGGARPPPPKENDGCNSSGGNASLLALIALAALFRAVLSSRLSPTRVKR